MYFVAMILIVSCINVQAAQRDEVFLLAEHPRFKRLAYGLRYVFNNTTIPEELITVMTADESSRESTTDAMYYCAQNFALFKQPEYSAAVMIYALTLRIEITPWRTYKQEDIQWGSKFGHRVLWVENDPLHKSKLKARTTSLEEYQKFTAQRQKLSLQSGEKSEQKSS